MVEIVKVSENRIKAFYTMPQVSQTVSLTKSMGLEVIHPANRVIEMNVRSSFTPACQPVSSGAIAGDKRAKYTGLSIPDVAFCE